MACAYKCSVTLCVTDQRRKKKRRARKNDAKCFANLQIKNVYINLGLFEFLLLIY